MPEKPDHIEKIYSRLTSKDNLRMWGQLYVSKTGQTAGGWLLDSWSENGAPVWGFKMHWFDRKENKLHNVKLDLGFGQGAMTVFGEDTGIDPIRSTFIRSTITQWEEEWLREGTKNQGS